MARGSLGKISKNSWRGRIDVPSPDKKRKQISKIFRAETQKEAEKLFNAWIGLAP